MTDAIEPFTIAIPEADLVDLRDRLGRTRWPERETVDDWSQGVPLATLQALCEHWRTGYDWRRCEARLNALPQFKTVIDGVGIHFIHVRSANPDAMPLLLTHGWPGSVIEFLEVIGPLTDPAAHGGDAADAFHVIIPSLPGYGFSDRPTETGWKGERIAAAWIVLMQRLGYDRYVAQGGDWGALVTSAIGVAQPPACLGIHLNMPLVFPEASDFADLTPSEAASVASLQFYQDSDSGYAKEQSTRPQTVGYALTDSAAGQAAWIYEKFHRWTDNDGTPESALDRDAMLDTITLYWLTRTAASSARLYWESMGAFKSTPLSLPVGVTVFPKELFRASRRWAERVYSNIIHWGEVAKGGHFAAFEQPAIFVEEIRNCFRQLR